VQRVDREQLLRLLDEEHAQLVDVLPADDYARSHLPGAINLPLEHLVDAFEHLDPTRPVVVYCADAHSDLSARAVARLRDVGISRVYRYDGGRSDWRAAGLPTEGHDIETPRAGTVARRDVPTARADEQIADVADRVGPHRSDAVVVVDDTGVVLGLLPGEALGLRDEAVRDEIEESPPTVRADEPLHELAARMRKDDAVSVLVTDPDGHLLGLARRDDVERLDREP
jgi:rhodanese-related sulfurtransferase/CBS domain-containing protein